ncbi:MAG: choice-of-anchor H family protein [Candidatus Schekmanbacteria bacterium]|nr:choice-of-anchor H family protein [Candidatus Schekmanbacteria bacterium]
MSTLSLRCPQARPESHAPVSAEADSTTSPDRGRTARPEIPARAHLTLLGLALAIACAWTTGAQARDRAGSPPTENPPSLLAELRLPATPEMAPRQLDEGRVAPADVPYRKNALPLPLMSPTLSATGAVRGDEIPYSKPAALSAEGPGDPVAPRASSHGRLSAEDVRALPEKPRSASPRNVASPAHALVATVYDAWWYSAVDSDSDGYARQARLAWDPDVSGGSGSLTVFEKIYWKRWSSSTWTLLGTTPTHAISGTATSDAVYTVINGGSHDLYDWRIDIYRAGSGSPDHVHDPANDSSLDNVRLETAAEDPAPTPTRATVYDAWWSSSLDSDGDGYARQARLNWDPDVSGGSGSLTVFEKIYWKRWSSSSWTLLGTTPSHTITGAATSDAVYTVINGGSHDLYDWRIDVYRAGSGSPDNVRDPGIDASLDNVKLETAGEDPAPTATRATIYDAWWTNLVDYDRDRYVRQARLSWDPDVSGGSGSLTVFEKIYWKRWSSSTWTLLGTTNTHTITGAATSDAVYVTIGGGSHDLYDWRIDVYRVGVSTPDNIRHAGNDWNLDNTRFETSAQDAYARESAGSAADPTEQDAAEALAIVAADRIPSPAERAQLDVTGNGKITAYDASLILQCATGNRANISGSWCTTSEASAIARAASRERPDSGPARLSLVPPPAPKLLAAGDIAVQELAISVRQQASVSSYTILLEFDDTRFAIAGVAAGEAIRGAVVAYSVHGDKLLIAAASEPLSGYRGPAFRVALRARARTTLSSVPVRLAGSLVQ